MVTKNWGTYRIALPAAQASSTRRYPIRSLARPSVTAPMALAPACTPEMSPVMVAKRAVAGTRLCTKSGSTGPSSRTPSRIAKRMPNRVIRGRSWITNLTPAQKPPFDFSLSRLGG